MNNSLTDKTILILASTLLFPARRNGASVRYHPFVKTLTQRGYTIDLIVINKFRDKYTEDELKQAYQIYRSINIIDTSGISTSGLEKLSTKIINGLKLLSPVGIPHGLIDNNKQHYLAEITKIIKPRKRYNFGIGVEVGGGNAILLNELPAEIKPSKTSCDFIDSAYLLRTRSFRSSLARINPITLLEDRKTKQWEKQLSESLPCIYIAKNDALATDSDATIICNSVVNEDYQTAEAADLISPSIGFIGNMGYAPNIDACDFLCNKIFPALLQKRPNIQLYIIGRNPSKQLLLQGEHPNIHITGEVDNIWSYIKPIDVFIFPMISGAGLQNKVLEAMYSGKPVVCSTIANEGIDATHSKELYIADTIAEYVRYTESALSPSDSIGKHGKKFVDDHFSLKTCVDQLEKTINQIPTPKLTMANKT